MIRSRVLPLLVAVLLAAGCAVQPAKSRRSTAPPIPSPSSQSGADIPVTQRGYILNLLAAVRVVPERPTVAGFDPGLFPASDDTDAPLSHNGCPTTEDVLGGVLTDVATRDGCVVLAGWLRDPYTGQLTRYSPVTAPQVGFDHVIPLRYAWDMGAHSWTPERRARFANDPGGLLVASAAVITQKGDSGPGGWLPPNREYRCTYVARFLDGIDIYSLAITTGDFESIMKLLGSSCTGNEAPATPEDR